MNNRLDENSNEPFGLEGWLESTRILLPLRSISVTADVAAGFATVEIDQLFEQSNENPLDCRFLFPLPADAAAYRCEMHVNGRMILAKVEEASTARQLYKKAKAAGHRAALAESERENLFTLQLGNLQPGDSILMRFAYLQPVQRLREQRTLRIPVNPGVRYIPGEPLLRGNEGPGAADDTSEVPGASRITPPRIDNDHPDAAGLSVQVRLRGENGIADSVSSPSHMIAVRGEKSDLTASLAVNHNMPDRDFVISWNEPKPQSPVTRAWLDANRRGVLEIRLPASPVASEASAVSSDPSHSSQVTRHNTSPPLDVYFLLDCSGSMEGSNWEGACKALASFLPRLGPDVRVWITLFESKVHDHDSKLARAAELDLGPNGEKICNFGTRGGTELVPALRHLGEKIRQHSTERDTAVLLITDGQVGNETQVIKEARSLGCPLHIVGVAMTMNDALGAVSTATGGRSVFLSPGQDIPSAIERFAPVLRAPVLTDLALPAGWTTADGEKLRNLVDGDDVIIPLSASADAPPLFIAAQDTSDGMLKLVPEEHVLPGAGLAWARARVRHLDFKHRWSDSLAVAKEFNILSEKSAFVAWDEAEKVPVAQTELFQPAMAVAEDMNVRYSLRDPADYCSAPPPEPRVRIKHGGTGGKMAPPKSPAEKSQEQLTRYLVRLHEDLQRFWDPQPIPARLQEIFDELKALLAASEEPDFANRVTRLLEALLKELHQIRKEEHNLLRKLRLVAGLNRRAEEALHLFHSKQTPVHP
jgi:Ca-activated chloride channel family protein